MLEKLNRWIAETLGTMAPGLVPIAKWAVIAAAAFGISFVAARLGVKVEITVPPPMLIENYYSVPAEDAVVPLAPDPAPEQYAEIVRQAKTDVSLVDAQAWHAQYDSLAVEGLGHRKRSLVLRTAMIRDRDVREAGQRFLAAIRETRVDGKPSFSIDKSALKGIDPDALKRWAAIALAVLQIVEPFVPPPYNLAVHAAVMLLKLYLARDEAMILVRAPAMLDRGIVARAISTPVLEVCRCELRF